LLLSVVALAILVGQASSGSAQNLGNPNPGVAPIHSSVRGMTYPEWRAALYIFLMGTPPELSPANDPTGEVSGALQWKDMYFLMGPGGGYHRTVKPGTKLWIPLGGSFLFYPYHEAYATRVANWIGTDPTALAPAELISLAANYQNDHIINRFCTINGVAMQDLERYVNESPAFMFYLEPGNYPPAAGSGIKGPAVSVGGNLILGPLPPGDYLIESGATWKYSIANGDWFDSEYTFTWECHLTVEN